VIAHKAAAFFLAVAGCGGAVMSGGLGDHAGTNADLAAPNSIDAATANTDASVPHTDAATKRPVDGSTEPGDAAVSSSADGGDGTPTRQQCTSNWGTGLSATHGRLDGYLVSIVPPSSTSGCNDDSSHVHLQVMMHGAIYDVAVDTGSSGDDIFYLTKNAPLTGGAWSEGWHTSDALSYASMGVSSTDFAELTPSNAPTVVETALASVNHISVFGTSYNANGMHLVHYESGEDGALVLEPQSTASQFLLFRFSTDKF
jgi:hypothetical protein